MGDKKFGIFIQNSPYNHLKVVEAMRLGLGLTTRDIQVYLFFLGDGLIALKEVSLGRQEDPTFIKHLKTLVELGQTLVAESDCESGSGNLNQTLAPKRWPRDHIFSFLTQCDGVVFV